jgi:hypothetical protein
VTARNILAIAAAAIAPVGLTACGGSGAIGRLGELKRVARTCPTHAHFAAYVAWDVRRTLRGTRVAAARLESLQRTAEKVAACGGPLRVVAFGPTAASTARLFDGELRPRGATENARLLRVPHLVDQVIEQVENGLPDVLAEVSGRGADPLSQFAAAEQFRRQLGAGYALHLVIETSGVVRGLPATESVAATTSASEPATDTAVPDLRGSDVVVAGLGKTGRGTPMPSPAVEALRVFYRKVCERTKAASCLAITDLAPLEG